MKKNLLILSALFISMTVFGQKNELKAASKAIKANDFSKAMTVLNQAGNLIDSAPQKLKAKFYYLRALAIYQNGSSQADPEKVSNAFNKLISYERGTKVKYTSEIKELTKILLGKARTDASAAYETATKTELEADFIKAARGFHIVYMLSPKDTVFLDNAALIYNRGKDYKTSTKLFNELLDLDYTGIATEYHATSKVNGEDVVFPDEKTMNERVKLGVVEKPRTEIKESRRGIIYKYLAENYSQLKEMDKALEILAKGRAEYPKDYDLLITEANIYYKKDNKAKFKELLQEAIAINPTDPNLHYNVGVMTLDQGNTEEAIKSFKKAIELKPDFSAAYQNIGTAIIDKTKPIIDEMNQSLSDFDKYDRLQAKQKEIYKEALPYLEKTYTLDKSNIDVVQTLVSLYENLEMNDKLKKFKEIYINLKK